MVAQFLFSISTKTVHIGWQRTSVSTCTYYGQIITFNIPCSIYQAKPVYCIWIHLQPLAGLLYQLRAGTKTASSCTTSILLQSLFLAPPSMRSRKGNPTITAFLSTETEATDEEGGTISPTAP